MNDNQDLHDYLTSDIECDFYDFGYDLPYYEAYYTVMSKDKKILGIAKILYYNEKDGFIPTKEWAEKQELYFDWRSCEDGID